MKHAALIIISSLQVILCWNLNGCGIRPKYLEPLRVKRHKELSDPIPSIFGGKEVVPHSWPWMVSVQVKYDRYSSHICGGCIISERYILTAAHCFIGGKASYPRNIVIKVGGHKRTDGVAYRIEEIKRHPRYRPSKLNYDIAVLKTKGIIKFNKKISPICLPSVREDYANETATAIGWGRTSNDGPLSRVLREVTIPVFKNKLCHMYDVRRTNIATLIVTDDTLLCAGLLEGGKDTCARDSGGPLLYQDHASLKWKVIGITSFGKGCGLPGYPGVYTRVSSYLPWITEIMDH